MSDRSGIGETKNIFLNSEPNNMRTFVKGKNNQKVGYLHHGEGKIYAYDMGNRMVGYYSKCADKTYYANNDIFSVGDQTSALLHCE